MIEMLWVEFPNLLSKYLKDRDIEIGEGWYHLVRQMMLEISEVDPECKIHQIKTKFGKLRVYTEMSPDKIKEVDAIVSRIEKASEQLNPITGRPINEGTVKE